MLQAIIVHWYAFFAWSMTGLFLLFYFALHMRSREARRYVNRVKILRLRDELRIHVAMNHLEERSDLYRHYDNLANALIRDAERYHFYGVMRAIKKFGKEILTKNQAEQRRIHEMLSKAHPDVQKTVGGLYLEIANLFMRQSKAIIFLALIVTAIQKIGSALFDISFEKKTGDLAAPAFVVKNAKHLGQQWAPACA